MIKINKSANVPAILTIEGQQETILLINAFTANPNGYTSREGVSVNTVLRMEFKNTIYGHKAVKEQLILEQYGKCCFCEATFADNSFGDVEHFRPKKAYRKAGRNNLFYPGYYWLAYSWSNLLFSCEKCNRKYKRNEFPLADETTRTLNHTHANPLFQEDRLLINPVEEDPAQFITFREEVPVPVNNSLKGTISIKVFGLERMNESRRDYLILLSGLLTFCLIDVNNTKQVKLAMDTFKFTKQQVLDKVADANRFFNFAATDKAKFAHCVRCKFPHLPTT